jgi:chromosome segregation ATPase
MGNETTDRLNQISAELAGILEARIQELMAAMKAAEQATRQVVSTEMEIGRYRQLQDTLAAEVVELSRDMGGLRTRAEEVRGQHVGLVAERDRLRDQVARTEREVREADGQIEDQRARLRALEEEGEALRRENNDLRSKIKTLEENVGRMRKLREELMMSISGLSQQMAALNLGSKE